MLCLYYMYLLWQIKHIHDCINCVYIKLYCVNAVSVRCKQIVLLPETFIDLKNFRNIFFVWRTVTN